MKFNPKMVLVSAWLLAGALVALSQTQSKPDQQASDRMVIGTTEVVLDAVVRDRKGRPVTNLASRDFEIYEDGVPQRVSSLRLVVRGSDARTRQSANSKTEKGKPAQLPTAAAAAAIVRDRPGPLTENDLSAVALVFDRLSTEARVRAHAAALAYLGQGSAPNDLVGVFAVNPSLKILQQFTSDKSLVTQAVDQAERENSTTPTVGAGQLDSASNLSYLNSLWKQQAAIADAIYNHRSTNMSSMADLLAIEMTIRSAEVFDALERDRQGQGTTDALLAIIEGMGKLPGRKAIILLAENVAVTARVMPQFRSVISNANRAGVSIYAVDSAGLRSVSSDVEAGHAMTLLGQRRLAIASSKEDTNSLMVPGAGGDVAGPNSFDLERNEELVRRNPEGILAALADGTGGLLISGSNDPGARLRQVNEDLHSYYLLSYSPKNQNYDGGFRQISVKVNRAAMDVQARKGYYALAESYDSPVLAYEAPGLALLSGESQANAFETRSGAFSFPEPARPGLAPVVVEIPAGSINFLVDNARTNYRSDFSVVVLIRNEEQKVVRKLSSHYLLNGPYDKLAAALNGKILFYKETQLPPGHYSVSAVVYDALARHSSASQANVLIPATEKGSLQLSSLVLVKNSEHLSVDNQQASTLFRFKEALLYPNLGEPLSKADDRELTLFLIAYSPVQAAATKLSLQIAQNGRTVGQLAYDLPAADQTGRIQYTGTIPLNAFPPGEYELTTIVSDGLTKATRSTRFTVQP